VFSKYVAIIIKHYKVLIAGKDEQNGLGLTIIICSKSASSKWCIMFRQDKTKQEIEKYHHQHLAALPNPSLSKQFMLNIS